MEVVFSLLLLYTLLCNELPDYITNEHTLTYFKIKLKTTI